MIGATAGTAQLPSVVVCPHDSQETMGVGPCVNTMNTLPPSTTQLPQMSTEAGRSADIAETWTPPDATQSLQQSAGEPAIYNVEPPSGTLMDTPNASMSKTNNISSPPVDSNTDPARQPIATSTGLVNHGPSAHPEAPSSEHIPCSPSIKKKAPGILHPGAANTATLARYVITCTCWQRLTILLP